MSKSRPTARGARWLLALLALVGALTLVAGCGGEDEPTAGGDSTTETESSEGTSSTPTEEGEPAEKADYEKGVRDALVAVTQTQDTLDEITDAKTSDDLAAGVAELKTTYDAVAEDLAGLTPPEDVADLHKRLVDASNEIAQAAGDAEESIRGGDSDTGGSLFKKAGSKYGETLTKLGEEFSAKGYEFR